MFILQETGSIHDSKKGLRVNAGKTKVYAYVQYIYIVVAKYQIAPSKAVVGVDRPMKAPSMHIQKHY